MIIAGDALECLRLMPAESVHCCVTSPPYYGLRDYGVAGQIGLEPAPEAYVERMVEVFREVRRVLRNDGTLWLNVGDSYAGRWTSRRNEGRAGLAERGRERTKWTDASLARKGLKDKDLIGIPWMLAFALRADGWYLRRDIIWHKPNPMPESVTDRPTSAHEYLFLLTKSGAPTYWTHRDHAGTGVRPAPDYRWQQTDDNGRVIAEQDFEPLGFQRNWPHWKRINLWDGHDYFYDAEAIKEPHARLWNETNGGSWAHASRIDDPVRGKAGTHRGSGYPMPKPGGRNKRSVWTIAPSPFREAHFATFPSALVEPCILAGTSDRGVCQKCGVPRERVVAKERHDGSSPARNDGASKRGCGNNARDDSENGRSHTTIKTIGWRPACSCCNAGDPVPATVLDPFFGAGTTGLVAERLGRDYIGIELNPAYALMAHRRIEAARPIKEAA